MKISEVINYFEKIAPLSIQEPYDNSGLIIGNPESEIKGILLTIDVTYEIINEAIKKGANLIISHHPLIFQGIKRITGINNVELSIISAIKADIAIYSVHTNIDSIISGVNSKIAEKLNLLKCRILSPRKQLLHKLVVFVPETHANLVRESIFDAGAGHIGNYDQCSFNTNGKGTFRGSKETNPYIGEKEILQITEEIKIETIFPKYLQKSIIDAMLKAHPYEEVAYDIFPLENEYNQVGLGMIGELEKPLFEKDFLLRVKEIFKCQQIRHTKLLNKDIKKVAVCGGSGSSLLDLALTNQADIFITSDLKYHQFFDAEEKILIADIGHYESEQFTTEIFYDLLTKKITTFATYFSEINTNPVNYL